MIENKKDNRGKFIKTLLIVIATIVALFIIYSLIKAGKIDKITKVKKILDTEYNDIKCVTEECDYVVASKNGKNGVVKKYIYSFEGKKILSYKEKNDNKSKTINEVSSVTSKYIIFKQQNKKDLEIVGYYITDLKGNKKYSTKNILTYLTENLILMVENTDEGIKYQVLNNNGKQLYSNIINAKTFNDNKVAQLDTGSTSIILNSEGVKLLEGYSISSEIKDKNNKTLYFVIKDTKNNLFYYYDINKNEIVGDNFQNYTEYDSEGNLAITKVKNNVVETYILDCNGNQTKYNNNSLEKYINEFKQLIDQSKYYVYDSSIYEENQTMVLADNKNVKSFGVLDTKTNKFKAIYKYNDSDNIKSTISKLDEGGYYQISCLKEVCGENKNIVYNLVDSEIVFENNDDNLSIQKYTEYEKDYKTVKYINDKKTSYVLYDKNNSKIISSSKQIVIVDKKILYTNDSYSDDLLLYSVSKNKSFNTENENAVRLNLSGDIVYKFDKEDETCILGKNNKVLECIPSNVKITYSKNLIMYVNDGKITLINSKKLKKNRYLLKNNEKMNDVKGDTIPPYRNTLFINNSTDNYVKIISIKGKKIKKIKDVEINNIRQKDDKNILVFTKKSKNDKDYYGLYLAK